MGKEREKEKGKKKKKRRGKTLAQNRKFAKTQNPPDVSGRATEATNTNPRAVTPIYSKAEISVTRGGHRLKESVKHYFCPQSDRYSSGSGREV